MRATPVYRCLSSQPLFLGGEFKLVAANLAIGGLATLLLHLLFWPVITVILHIVFVQMAKRDANTRAIYMAYSKQADRYEPWVDPATPQSDRPTRIFRGGELL